MTETYQKYTKSPFDSKLHGLSVKARNKLLNTKVYLYCQNSNCPNLGHKFKVSEMVEIEDFHFCCDECASTIINSKHYYG